MRSFRQHTTQPDLDEIEEWTEHASRMYEGAGSARRMLTSLIPTMGRHYDPAFWKRSNGMA